MRKVDHRSRRKSRSSTFSADSGYADSGYASYPTLSRTTSSSHNSWQGSIATLTPSIRSAATSVATPARSRPSDDFQRRASAPFLSPPSYTKHKPLPPLPQKAEDDIETSLHAHTVPLSKPTHASLGALPQVPAHPPGSECTLAKRVEKVARIAIVRKCTHCNASPLHAVAAGGGLLLKENFRQLLNKYKDSINSRDMFGNSPLHAAAAGGLGANEFQLLYDAGADLLARNDKGETFLHLITADHKKDSSIMILEWATDQKIDFKLSTFDGKTILHSVCERNVSLWSLAKMWYFLRTLGTDINLRDRWGKTAMDYLKDSLASQQTHQDMPTLGPEELDKLLESHLPRYKDRHNCKQLVDDVEAALPATINTLETVARSDAAMFEVVRDAEFDPAVQDGDGKNALHCLAHIVRFREYDGRVQPPSFRKYLVDWSCVNSKVDANAYDRCGSTPLHSFLTYPRANDDEGVLGDIVNVLLANGANPNMRDRAGNTALHLACLYGHYLCTKALRDFFQKDATMYKNATRARNDRNQSPVNSTLSLMNTSAWSPQEKQVRRECLKLITHNEFTEDDTERSRFWGIPNSTPALIPNLTVSPASVTRPPSPMDES